MTDDVYDTVRRLMESNPAWHGDGSWDEAAGRELHARVVADGWSRVGVPESLNGSGGDSADAVEIVRAATATGTPSPLADCLIVGGHLMRISKIGYPRDAETVVPGVPTDLSVEVSPGDGCASGGPVRVPWARWATHLVVPVRAGAAARVALFRIGDLRVRDGENLAGHPCDLVDFTGACPVEFGDVASSIEDLVRAARVEGALARSVQMTAAMRSAMELSIVHARQRVQFGKPLSAFQAIQQYLAEMAGEAAAAEAATSLAGRAEGRRRETAVAVAKVRVGSAAGTVARIAHQVHGAIGITQEYALQRFTRPLWAWRDEFGSEATWAEFLAAAVQDAAEQGFWNWVADSD